MLLLLACRYNKLLAVVQQSLLALQSACAGLSVLDSQGEAALAALANNQLPRAWAAAAYPSSKPLASWMADLVQRVAFMRQWLTTGEPVVFWLPGMWWWCCGGGGCQIAVAFTWYLEGTAASHLTVVVLHVHVTGP